MIGLILAGGRSSRMGCDKALLEVHGLTLLARTQAVLREAGATHVAISGERHGGIVDRWPGFGPVGGLAGAADALPDGTWLVVPVDMPRLSLAVLAPLLSPMPTRASRWQGHPMPMRIDMDATVRQVLVQMMSTPGPQCSLSVLQQAVGVTSLPLDGTDTRALVNCNTPDEWHEATA